MYYISLDDCGCHLEQLKGHRFTISDNVPFGANKTLTIYEPRCEKTGLWGFRPGPTQTELYNDTRWLEA